jgi:hypothetical protein
VVVLAGTGSIVQVFVVIAGVLLAGGLCASARYERSLLIYVLYIGVLDGYLKLSTGIANITLLRDLLLYSIVAGAVYRFLGQRRHAAPAPLLGFVIAWVAIVAVQIFNPGSTLGHAFQASRQHLEFVPLFFFGYFVMNSQGRIRALLVVAVIVAAANAVANIVQFNLTPAQFSQWGPGYQALISGAGGVSARSFKGPTGVELVRPFGLGGDFGFGAITCAFAVGPALALIVLARHNKRALAIALPGLALIVVGLVTGQSRASVLGAVIGAVAFCALAIVSRKAVISLLVVAALGGATYLVVSSLASSTSQSGLARYGSIAPSKVVTTVSARGTSLSGVPAFAAAHPLGTGLGTLGPAASASGAHADVSGANSENEFSFLLAEVGVPGLLVLLSLLVALVITAIRVVRSCASHVDRLLLAGFVTPLFFLAVTWFSGTSTTGSYTSSYFWFTSGVLAAQVELARRTGRPGFPAAEDLSSA